MNGAAPRARTVPSREGRRGSFDCSPWRTVLFPRPVYPRSAAAATWGRNPSQGVPMYRFLETNDSWTLTLQRWVLGGVLFAHGAQKLLGWFGGYGYAGTMG